MKYLSSERIAPRGRQVLVRASHAGHTGSLLVPDLSRYPETGWVEAIGPDVREPLAPGDFIVLEKEGELLAGAEIDYFEVVVDFEHSPLTIALDRAEERRITSLFKAHQVNSDIDPEIRALDLFTDEGYRFRVSDILDVYTDVVVQRDTRIEYLHATILALPEGTHYLIHENLIMCKVET